MTEQELQLLTEVATDRRQLSKTIDGYLKLRALLRQSPNAAGEFKKSFSSYYGLNGAGLSDDWKAKYFELLFNFGKKMPKDAHSVALRELLPIKRRKGDTALQFSFVTKLVAIHDEREPLFDKFVQNYFGLGAPTLRGLDEFRISGFLKNLDEIKRRYAVWLKNPRFQKVIQNLRSEYPDLKDCHPIRLCDFLVWAVGKKYQ